MSVHHEFGPIFDEHSKVLVLGTIPSVKSREGHFYYHHPRNRFWQVTAAVAGMPVPETIPEKRAMLLAAHIAVYDVVESCEIDGSADATIRDVEPVDLSPILARADIAAIFANGAKAKALYDRYLLRETGRQIVRLPSTSPANAAWSLARLCAVWKESIAPYLGERKG